MNPHQYRQLKRLFDARNKGNNERDAYLRALVVHKLTEKDLIEEIQARQNERK